MDDKSPAPENTPTLSITQPGLLAAESSTGTHDAPNGLEQEPSPAQPATGAVTIPGYEIMGELGRGGMGVVYKAWQPRTKRFVAIKMMLEQSLDDERRRRRFLTEAQTLASLSHPNIISLYEVSEIDGAPYFSFEYCSGGSLAKKISATPMLPTLAASMAEKLARAVAIAHQKNIIHRDLKPGNILLTPEGEPKITDFGVAKNLDRDEGNTRAGSILGTPNYMSPEQAFDDSRYLTAQADVYALGAILYEMLTGRPPFKGVTAMETLEQLRTQEIVPPRMLVGRVPEDLQAICLKCLRKDKSQRYPSAAELAEDLHRFRARQPIEAKGDHHGTRLWSWINSNRWTALGLVVVGVIYVMAVIGAAKHWLQ